MSEWTLKFMPVVPGWLIVLLGAAAITFFIWSYGRTSADAGTRLSRILMALRIAALCAILAALFGPTIRTYVWTGQRGSIAVVADDSESLLIPDMGDAQAVTRAETLKGLLDGSQGLLSRLARTAEVQAFAFGEELRPIETADELASEDGATDIAGMLQSLSSASTVGEYRTMAAVLVSDGADTEGGQIEPNLRRLASAGLPLYTVAVGGNEFRDIEVSELRTSRTVRKDTLVSVSATVRSRGIQPTKTEVKLIELPLVVPGDGAPPAAKLIAKQVVELGGPPRSVKFEFLPTETGFREYAVEVPVAEGEVVERNNRREFALSVERRKIRVLYMEGSEYRRPERKLWEFQYLEEALKEDGDIEITSLLRKEVKNAREAGIYTVQDPEHGYPRTKKDLFEFDVIISSDIDIEFFTREQLEHTVEFVGRRGGGFVMIGGWTAFGAGGYDESILDKILPVDMIGRKHEGFVENEDFRLDVTVEGLLHPLMQIGETPELNRSIWEGCPPFSGHNQVQRAKPAATVLAYHESEKTLYGKTVILAVQDYGRGRSMAMTTDTTAGWGQRFEEEFGELGDNRHYKKFWQNAIRWLAEYRLQAPSNLVQLEFANALVARGQKGRARITVLDEFYEPAAGADVELVIRRPDGKSVEATPLPDPETPGLYVADIVFTELGRHTVEAKASAGGTPLGTDRIALSVRPSSREFERPEVNAGLMRRMSERTGGKYYELHEVGRIPEDIRDLVASIRRYEDEPIWDNIWLWSAIVALLTAEWFIRKKIGLP